MDSIMVQYPFKTTLSFKPFFDYLKERGDIIQNAMPCTGLSVDELILHASELNGPIDDFSILDQHRDLVQRLLSLVFPPLVWNEEAVAAVVPFSIRPIAVSPKFRKLFLKKDGTLTGRTNWAKKQFDMNRVVRSYLFILKKFYGFSEHMDYPVIRIVKDRKTGLEQHFKMKFDFRFIDVKSIKKPKVLSTEERDLIREHLTEPEVLRKILPPENFELSGFTLLQAVDVTKSEVISELERDLIDQNSITSKDGFLRIQDRLRTLFRHPDLQADLSAIHENQVLFINSGSEMTRNCIFADSSHAPLSEFKGTAFEKAVETQQIIRIPDISKEPMPSHRKKAFLENGIRSLMVTPLQYKGKTIGTIVLGTPTPKDLGPLDTLLMEHISPLFSMAINNSLNDLENRIQGIIKEKCTAIHPTVEWRFRKAAIHHLENLRRQTPRQIEPIVFENVYPLYGISDIRGSSLERNRVIQADLSEHLELALNVIHLAGEAKSLLILHEQKKQLETHLTKLQKGMESGDELSLVKFLQTDVEPLFPHIKGFGPKVLRAIKRYESAIDARIGSVYRLRKDFEDSISLLTNHLAAYLDQEESELQTVFPHFFERHRTDGIDYLIYLGASLNETGDFNELYLKNLRLWQLKLAAGFAWQTEQLKSTLKIPLQTAHLILVQNTPLSIRFRFDEKRFDVDGTYDVRQEIIKSRIDKAYIKGGNERLTQPGKIAIVYSHLEEAQEMRHHIDFLKHEGYLTGEVEDLNLDDMQGVQGLKSLRVSIDLKSKTMFEKINGSIPQAAVS